MRKSTKRFLAILVSMLLCASLAVTIILACPMDPECPGPNDCHMYETDDGPVNHHLGAFSYFDETFTVEEGDPSYCPGTYYWKAIYCDACGSYVVQGTNKQEHDLQVVAPDPYDESTWYYECSNCGYTCDYFY